MKNGKRELVSPFPPACLSHFSPSKGLVLSFFHFPPLRTEGKDVYCDGVRRRPDGDEDKLGK
jgi:hypothetical protein